MSSLPPKDSTDSWHGWNPRELSPPDRDDPYPLLNRLREEVPVHRTPAGVWRMFRHADVVRLLKDTKVGMRTTEGVLPDVEESVGARRVMLPCRTSLCLHPQTSI